MGLEEPKFVTFIQNIFTKYECDYEGIKNKFYSVFNDNPKKRDNLATLSHFYYFICTPDKINTSNLIREELQIVGITSLIEAMMEEFEYKDVFSYFASEFPDKNKIEDFQEFKNTYLIKYGATRKIVNYFKEYIPKEEADIVLSKIKKWSSKDKKSIPLSRLEELAKFLYQMRSDFVHNAEMRCLRPHNVNSASMKVGDNYYTLTAGIADVLSIFEKSFVTYWKKKYEALEN